METIILQTENNQVTKEVLDLIKNMKSVKFIAVENDIYKINADDLVLPGRVMNEEELANIAMVMDSETDFKKSIELDIDFIGEYGPLTKSEELGISEFLNAQKLLSVKKHSDSTINSRTKTRTKVTT